MSNYKPFTVGAILAAKWEHNSQSIKSATASVAADDLDEVAAILWAQDQARRQAVYWHGNLSKCDVCSNDFNGTMYDVSVRGRWGNSCQRCFNEYGCSVGTGRGQKYEQQSDGRWLKTEG